MEQTDEQSENSQNQLENVKQNRASHLAPWQFKKGQSGNPGGRPLGKSLKEYAKEYLAKMTEEEKEGYFHGMNKKDVWMMAEGNPATATDITTKGEAITPLLVKFIENEPNSGNTN